MLNSKPNIEGNFNFVSRLLEETEKKYYGIFISHANKDNDDYLYPLIDEMKKQNLHPMCDKDILSGGDDYQKIIESYLDCYAGVIIITENSLKSEWVNYEIGVFAGNGTKVFLYDPKDMLSKHIEIPGVANIYGSHIGCYLPAYTSIDELITALHDVSPYADMFFDENEFIKKSDFLELVNARVDMVIASIESPVFDKYADLLKKCSLSTIIPNFGMFYPEHGDGEHCYSPRFHPLKESKCPVSHQACALVSRGKVTEENKECVILNHTLQNGKFIGTGELDIRGIRCEVSSLVFNLPLHKIYGTEFKFFIDIPDDITGKELIEMFNSIGVYADLSNNIGSKRIYISLPERRTQGLYRLNHVFSNNFLCPYAGRPRDN